MSSRSRSQDRSAGRELTVVGRQIAAADGPESPRCAGRSAARMAACSSGTPMSLHLFNSLTRRVEPFVPARSRPRDHVRVRAHGLQLRPHRQRPRPGGVRRAGRPAAPALRRAGLRPQHHRRRRQDQQRRPANRACRSRRSPTSFAAAYREDMAALGVAPPDLEPRRHRATSPQIIAMIERLIDGRPRLRGRRPRAVLGRQLRRLRQALAPRSGRDAGRRARRSGAVQARPGRLRAVEAVHRRPARLGFALGPRPARLAHRVLGDGRGAPGRDHRHPRRRRRPAVPAPRERDRAERVRARRQGVRALLAAQRHAQLRRRQDVASRWATSSVCTTCCASIRPRRCATRCCRRITGSRWTGRTA